MVKSGSQCCRPGTTEGNGLWGEFVLTGALL